MKALAVSLSLKLLAGLLAWVASTPSHAVINNCGLTVSAVNYTVPIALSGAPWNYLQQGTISVTCTRTNAGDSTLIYLEVDPGGYWSASSNKARLTQGGVNYDIHYHLTQDSACTNLWGNATSANGNSITLNLPSAPVGSPVSTTASYFVCIPSSQFASFPPSGTYTDSAVVRLMRDSRNPNKNASLAQSTLLVNLQVSAACTLSRAPSQILFNYTAFSASAVFAGTDFEASCSNTLAYTLAVSPASGAVAGLNYTLGLTLSSPGSASQVGPPTLSTTGNPTGKATHYINGSMTAGQAGQVGTVVPQVHTLTITY